MAPWREARYATRYTEALLLSGITATVLWCTVAAKANGGVPACAERQHGVAWVAGHEIEASQLDPVVALGANWISQTPFGWMKRPSDPTVTLVTGGRAYWGETDEGLVATHRMAKAAGLNTALKPHLWVRGSWPGDVRMANDEDWARFFADYETFILHYARLAAREKMELFVVGTELKLTSREREREWRALINKIRAVYRGQLTYAANWDEVFDVPFWDALDLIGVNAYFPLAETDDAKLSIPSLVAAWQPTRARLEQLSRKAERPVLFTEIGYRPSTLCAVRPWEHDGGDRDENCQALAFEALFETFWDRPWVAGMHIWKWFPRARAGNGFSPQGKAAETVIRRHYACPEAGAPKSRGDDVGMP